MKETVRSVCAAIPAGNVTSYGEVGKVAGVGARYVGWFLSRHGAQLPWWRVVRADGTCHDPDRARAHWQAEGLAFSAGRVDMRQCGIAAEELQSIWQRG